MDRVHFIVCLFLGVFFAYISVPVFGYGAAIAIPVDMLLPFAKNFPTTTLAVIDLITQALPLCLIYCLIYCLLALLIKHFKLASHWYYLVLCVPFYILHSYYFILQLPAQNLGHTLGILLPKYIVLGLFVLYFFNHELNKQKA
jgi:hypothetical protein